MPSQQSDYEDEQVSPPFTFHGSLDYTRALHRQKSRHTDCADGEQNQDADLWASPTIRQEAAASGGSFWVSGKVLENRGRC